MNSWSHEAHNLLISRHNDPNNQHGKYSGLNDVVHDWFHHRCVDSPVVWNLDGAWECERWYLRQADGYQVSRIPASISALLDVFYVRAVIRRCRVKHVSLSPANNFTRIENHWPIYNCSGRFHSFMNKYYKKNYN